MKRMILLTLVTLICVYVAVAQTHTQQSATASNQTVLSANRADKTLTIQPGTQLAAELQQTIDARKAKVGDPVSLKTARAIKSQGQTVVNKGARLIGHITDVVPKSAGNSISRIGLVFDRLENGSLAVPITATITSIASGRTNARANNEDLFANETNTSGRATASSSRQSGGLLGGGSNAVGGVVNTTTSTLGNVLGGTTAAVDSTLNATTSSAAQTTSSLGRPLGQIQITESTSASAEGGSTLSLRGENLRLEKGTTFNVVIGQSADVGKAKEP